MLNYVNLIKKFLIGFVVSMLLILSVNVIAHFTDTNKIKSMVLQAGQAGELDYLKDTRKDSFTDCSLLTMQIIRENNLWLDTFNTKLGGFADQHPCVSAKTLVENGTITGVESYVNYWFGTRYIAQIFFNFLTYSQLHALYHFLSYAAFAIFLACCFRKSRVLGILFTPLAISAFIGFGNEKLGENIGHAPGFIFPMLLLSGLVYFRNRFKSFELRMMFFVLLGVLTTYLDLLTGAIPFIFILAIITDYFLFNSTAAFSDNTNTLKSILFEKVSLAAALCITFVLTISTKLLVLSKIFNVPITNFKSGLLSRVGDVVGNGEKITYSAMFHKLWDVRDQFFGSFIVADIFFLIALSSWLFTVIVVVIWFVKKKHSTLYFDVAMLFLGALGVLAWYLMFLNHTFVHVLHMGRIVIIPASFGVTSMILCATHAKSASPKKYYRSIVICGVVSLFVSYLSMSILIGRGVPSYQIEASAVANVNGADRVSCSPLGVRKDGVPDKIVSFTMTPDTIFYNRNVNITQIQIARDLPGGVYETGQRSFILGVTTDEKGPLINKPDGTVNLPVAAGYQLNYCSDHADTNKSLYRIMVKVNEKWSESVTFKPN